MAINSFYILDDVNQENIGSGLYLGPSIMDHRCVPTASVTFEGRNIVVRSLIDMPERDFSQVYITYVDLMDHSAHRQQHLLKSYYFLCQCSRCLDPKFEEDMFSVKCLKCTSPVLVGAHPEPENFRDYKCRSCGENSIPDAHFLYKYLETLDIVKDQLNEVQVPLDVSNFCLNIMDRSHFYPLHIYYVKATEFCFEGWWDRWTDTKKNRNPINFEAEKALEYGHKLAKSYSKYSQHIWSYEGIILAKLALLERTLGRNEPADNHYEKAEKILVVSKGKVAF